MLDGTAWCSLLSGCLVSSGRQAPPKICYFGRFCHILHDVSCHLFLSCLALSLYLSIYLSLMRWPRGRVTATASRVSGGASSSSVPHEQGATAAVTLTTCARAEAAQAGRTGTRGSTMARVAECDRTAQFIQDQVRLSPLTR